MSVVGMLPATATPATTATRSPLSRLPQAAVHATSNATTARRVRAIFNARNFGAVRSGIHVLLQAREVSKAFGGSRVLRGLTFSLARGSIMGLIGPNGAGKTTLFNCITGVLAPEAGAIRLEGEEITDAELDSIIAGTLAQRSS